MATIPILSGRTFLVCCKNLFLINVVHNHSEGGNVDDCSMHHGQKNKHSEKTTADKLHSFLAFLKITRDIDPRHFNIDRNGRYLCTRVRSMLFVGRKRAICANAQSLRLSVSPIARITIPVTEI